MPPTHGVWAPLQAGIIKRCLNQYPFPCAKPSNSHVGFCRSDVVSLFSDGSWATDDPVMQRVIHILRRDPGAAKQFRECGLKASNYKEVITSGCGNSSWSELPDRDVLMTNSEETAGLWRIITIDQAPRGQGKRPNAHQRRIICVDGIARQSWWLSGEGAGHAG